VHHTEFMLPIGPTRVHNSNGISIGSAIFFTAHDTVLSGMPGHVLSPKNYPLAWGDLDRHLIHGSLGSPESNPKRHLDPFRLQPFFAGPPTMDNSIIFTRWLYCALPCNTCFLGPTLVHNPNGILIGSTVFAQVMAVCRRACLFL